MRDFSTLTKSEISVAAIEMHKFLYLGVVVEVREESSDQDSQSRSREAVQATRIIDQMTTDLAAKIYSIFCDTKAGRHYQIKLKPGMEPTVEHLKELKTLFESSFENNGVIITSDKNKRHFGPYWRDA